MKGRRRYGKSVCMCEREKYGKKKKIMDTVYP